MRSLFALLVLTPAAVLAQQTAIPAQQPATAAPSAVITFTFDNPALQPAHYVITVPEQGAGRYTSEPGSAPTQGTAQGALQTEAQNREVTIPDPQRARLFALARKNKLFATDCANTRGKLAFTGNKTLAYRGPDGAGMCTFNYARDGKLGQAADDLIAVQTTLEEGRKLETLLAHDKLGLNAEIDLLAEEQAGGRAMALANIAPVLQAIAADPDVLNHTRASAEALLKH